MIRGWEIPEDSSYSDTKQWPDDAGQIQVERWEWMDEDGVEHELTYRTSRVR